ncbi:MAG TPA: exosome complex protein Rrp42 [Candidatus Lokiarchaeia archaeon]|nr:exosome complex protein Rrp42 [Candidatus Lokiarchaeia archaeon]
MDLSISKKISTIERDYITDLLVHGTRLDGRGFLEYREIKIDAGPMLKADGSARVFLGDTQACVGVKFETGSPFPETPNEGVVTAMAELVPFASPMYESGPPDESAIELARVVDRGIRHSDIIEKSRLVLVPGEEVFLLYVDIYYISHNGNPWDAASLAALCALKSTMIPNLENQEVMGKKYLVPVGDPQPLGIEDYPVTITFAKIGENMIVDPALMEELICDARISFCINKNSLITSMQKNGSGTFTTDELIKCAKNARDLAPALQQLAKDYERDLTNM